jgi:enoyl-CoA hydratase/carnithine racemase
MITLNRPQKLNTFDTTLVRGFNGALQELKDDSGIRAVVICGEGEGEKTTSEGRGSG